jgi:RNase P/RNase MRP subunit p30
LPIADEYGIPIVISSGATNPLQMRKPMDVAGLTTLFDMDKPKALNAVSKTPFSIVEEE